MADATLTLDAEINTSNWQKGVSDIDSGTDKIKKSANEADEAIEHIGDSATETSSKSETLKDSFSNALDGISSLAENVGVNLPTNLLKVAPFAAAAAAVGSAIGTGITSALDTINLQGTLQAKLGSGSQAAKKAGVVAGNLYNDGWGESLEDIGNTVATVSQAIRGIGQDDLQVVSRATELWSQTFDTDVSEGVRGVKVLMDQFGLSSRDATDLMTVGMQNGLNYTGELADNLSEYSGRWAEAGVSAQDYFSLLQAGVDNGAYSLDKVGDFLNEFLTSLSDGRMEEALASFSQGTQDVFNAYKDGGATAQDVLDAVIGEMNGMTNETERASIASTLWSSLGEDNAWSMIGALAGVSDSYGDVSGATQQAMEDSKSLGQQFDSVTRTMSSALGSVFMPVMEQVVDGLSDFANDFQQTMMSVDLTPFTNMVSGVFTGLVQTIGTILSDIGTTFQTAFAPIGEMITTQLMPAFQPFMDALQNLANEVMPVIMTAIETIAPILATLVGNIIDTMTVIFDTVTPVIDSISQFIQAALPIIQTAFSIFSQYIMDSIKTAFTYIQDVVSAVMPVIQAIIDTVTALIKGDWEGVWEGIKNIFSSVWEAIKGIVEAQINYVKSMVENVLNAIKKIFESIWNAIKGTVEDVWNGIKDAVSNAIDGVKSTVENALNSIKDFFSNAWNAAKDTVSNAWSNITSTVSDGANNVVNFVKDIPNKIKSFFSNAGSLLLDAGRQIINGLIRGITGAVSGAISAVKNAVGSIINGAKSLLGIASPSKVFRDEIGKYIPEGMAIGIERSTPDATKAIQGMTDSLMVSANPLADIPLTASQPNAADANTLNQNMLTQAFLKALQQLPEVRTFRTPDDAAVWLGRAMDNRLGKISQRRKVGA